MITAKKLVEWFYYMYNNNWGYIFGKSGQLWTQKMQDRATNEMAVKYGKRWIGHYVTDCSGAFVFAFKKEGESIYHGSDTIYKRYCSSKGKLKNGFREDGEPIKPGTAVFLYDKNKKTMHHIGLYVGANTCIEAKGTIYGVVTSTLGHWDYWGELKDIDYTDVMDIVPGEIVVPKRLLRRGCKGPDVKELQHALNLWNGVNALEEDGAFGKLTEAAVKIFQNEKGLKADGLVGPQTWKELEAYINTQPDEKPDEPTTKSVKMAVTCKGPAEMDTHEIADKMLLSLEDLGLTDVHIEMEVE